MKNLILPIANDSVHMVVQICFSIECFAAVYASIFSHALMHSEMQKELCLDTIALKATCVGAHISNPSSNISRVKVLLVDPEVIIPCIRRLLAILAFIFLLFPFLSLHLNLLVLMVYLYQCYNLVLNMDLLNYSHS